MVEMMAVVAIVVVLAAAGVPSLIAFRRTYNIRVATQGVAAEIQAARSRAIRQNVNCGVDFVITGPDRYRWIVEDTWDEGTRRVGICPRDLGALAGLGVNEGVGPEQSLPQGVTFATPTAGGNVDRGFRFNRLGAMCDPGTPGCPAFSNLPGGPSLVSVDANGTAEILIQQIQTSVTKWVRIVPGGRVEMEK
jgi:type II secretory pathway pseudopilin PulG